MRIPGSADLAAAVRTLLPSSQRTLPIRAPAPDPGLFGPGSVTWRVMAEPMLMLGAGRALLIEGDFRDWQDIETWATGIGQALAPLPATR